MQFVAGERVGSLLHRRDGERTLMIDVPGLRENEKRMKVRTVGARRRDEWSVVR